MKNFKIVNIIFVMFVGGVVCVREDQAACCQQGYVRKMNNQYQCWQPESNLSITLPPSYKQEMLVAGTHMNFTIDDAGHLVILLKNREIQYDPGMFCLGRIITLNGIKRMVVVLNEDVTHLIHDEVYGYFMAASATCLLVTALHYAVRKELRDLQGKSIINICSSLGIGLGILAAMKLIPYHDMNLCAARGFLTYFFVVASFFWTNALSIQIFLHMRHSTKDVNEEKGFGWYALYSWGCPTVLTVAMAIVNYMPGDHLKPGIGLNHCWFFNSEQQWRYMYSVLSILIAVNVVIFIYLTTVIWRHSYSNDKIKHKFSQTTRLFVIMGVLWVFEMISNVAPHHWVWDVTDLVNSLQGVLIYVVLVLFPRRTQTKSSADGSQFKINISTEKPYSKF